jgi:hypothetical protein
MIPAEDFSGCNSYRGSHALPVGSRINDSDVRRVGVESTRIGHSLIGTRGILMFSGTGFRRRTALTPTLSQGARGKKGRRASEQTISMRSMGKRARFTESMVGARGIWIFFVGRFDVVSRLGRANKPVPQDYDRALEYRLQPARRDSGKQVREKW